MKLKKKTAMLMSFTLGTLLFATTALADIANKSGYEQLKDSLKLTAEKASEEFDSFTLDISFVVKDNGQTIMSQNELEKYDRKNSTRESTSARESIFGEKYSGYNYFDKHTMIGFSNGDNTYHVTEFTDERKFNTMENPFKEDRAEDVEKIADALVGSLKDYVMVNENPDGSKALSGSLSEVQIPPLVNAVSSFALKQEFNRPYEQRGLNLSKDIYVKEVKGTASINKDGVLENVLGTAVLSGTDAQGKAHEISIEILGKMSDINSTVVTKPDLTGKNVVKEVAKSAEYGPEFSNPQKFVGKFKNDIVIEKNGKLVKAGERIVQITSIDSQSVSGRYHEEYAQGFEQLASIDKEFNFEGTFEQKSSRNARLTINADSGKTYNGDIYFDEYAGKIYFNVNYLLSRRGYDSNYSPAFE